MANELELWRLFCAELGRHPELKRKFRRWQCSELLLRAHPSSKHRLDAAMVSWAAFMREMHLHPDAVDAYRSWHAAELEKKCC